MIVVYACSSYHYHNNRKAHPGNKAGVSHVSLGMRLVLVRESDWNYCRMLNFVHALCTAAHCALARPGLELAAAPCNPSPESPLCASSQWVCRASADLRASMHIGQIKPWEMRMDVCGGGGGGGDGEEGGGGG